MENQVNLKIALRRDTLENWLAINPVLMDGEMAVVKSGDAVELKIGNGVSTFAQLPYVHQHLSSDALSAKSFTQGLHAAATQYGMAAGAFLSANADFSQAFGFNAETLSGEDYSFVWNGYASHSIGDYYTSHGKGSFSINPLSGLSGFYIGEKNLQELLDEAVNIAIRHANDVSNMLSDYYLKTETSSDAELGTEFDKKIEMDYGDEVLSLLNNIAV